MVITKEYTYEYCSSKFKTIVEWLLRIVPESTDAGVRQKVRFEIITALQNAQKVYLYSFCEEHNYCPMCGDGGWNCEYHAHKR